MNTPKWIIAHFSPTGGTKKVADAIAAGFERPIVEMDLTRADFSVTLGENDALLETREALEANGFRVIAAAAFIAEHSMYRCIAAGRPDAQDEALCRRFAADVMAKADDAAPIQVPGNTPYKELKPSAFHPAANDTCTKCGTCAEDRPTGAIPLADPSPTDNERCINCMRCVASCPMNSRALPDAFRAMITKMLDENAAGYKEPVVFL